MVPDQNVELIHETALSAVRWKVANNIVVAWIITIPASAFMAALAYAVVGVLE